jgi:hypothetical protein
LNWVGPRVGFKKTQGLFSKIARLKRYFLIWAVRSGSDGSNTFQFGRSDLNGGGPYGPIWIAKTNGPIWTMESGLLDLDRRAGIEGVRDLISRVDLGSDG